MATSYAQSKVQGKNQYVVSIGTQNDLSYMLEQYDTSFADFRASVGNLLFSPYNNYMYWKSCDPVKSFDLFVLNKRTYQLIDSINFIVELPPNPTIVVGSSYHDLYLGRKGLNKNRFRAVHLSKDIKQKCSIERFSIQLQKDGGFLKEIENEGREFTENTQLLFSQFDKGDTLFLNEFAVKCGCETRDRRLADRLKLTREGKIIKVEKE